MVIIDESYYEDIFPLMHEAALAYVKKKKALTNKRYSLYDKINEWLQENIHREITFDDILAMKHCEIESIAKKIDNESILQNKDIKHLKKIYYIFSPKNSGLVLHGTKITGYDFAKTFCEKEYSCPYCNAVKLDVRELEDAQALDISNQREPHLDHFFPCSIYPIFALSTYNLIPACVTCNRMKDDAVLPYSPCDDSITIDKMTKFILKIKGDDLYGLDIEFQEGMEKNNSTFNLKGKYCSTSYDRLATLLYKKILKYSNESYRDSLKVRNKNIEEEIELEFETIMSYKKYFKAAFSKWRSDIIRGNLKF